jgi:hypothetical protein
LVVDFPTGKFQKFPLKRNHWVKKLHMAKCWDNHTNTTVSGSGNQSKMSIYSHRATYASHVL